MKVNKRALMALVVIGVVTFSACGVVGLTATRVSAATCSWREAPTTGIVGQELTFSLQSGKPFPQGLQFRFDGEGTITDYVIPVTGQGVLGESILTYTTSFAFPRAGNYTFSVWAAENDPGCAALHVVIEPIKKLELTGPTTGTVGDSLTYTVKAQACDAEGRCQPAPEGTLVLIQECNPNRECYPPHISDIDKNLPYQRVGRTDAQGEAQIAFSFQDAGEHRMGAFTFDLRGFLMKDTGGPLNVTIAARSDSSGGAGGGSPATSASATNGTFPLNVTSNASGTSSIPGFEILVALIGLAITALFMVNKHYR
jgi:hypothetical protein